MASIKISELTSVAELTKSDALPIVNGNETKKVTIEKLGDILATKDYVNDSISELGSLGFTPIIVETLPTENISTNTIYLILNTTDEEENTYDEYIYIDDKWEIIGSTSTSIDLSNYYTKSEIDTMISTGGGGSDGGSGSEFYNSLPVAATPSALNYEESINKISAILSDYYQKNNTFNGLTFVLSHTQSSFEFYWFYGNSTTGNPPVPSSVTFIRYWFSPSDIKSVSIQKISWRVTIGEDNSVKVGAPTNTETLDSIQNKFLPKDNTTTYTPSSDYNPATKKYVDDAINAIDTSGGSSGTESLLYSDMPVAVLSNVNPSGESDFAIISEIFTNYYKKFGTLNKISFAISSGATNAILWHATGVSSSSGQLTFNRFMFNPGFFEHCGWHTVTFTPTYNSDGTVTVSAQDSITVGSTFGKSMLLLNNTTAYTPTSNYHPATKKYVDDAIANIDIPESGGTGDGSGVSTTNEIPSYRLTFSITYNSSGLRLRPGEENGDKVIAAVQDAYNKGYSMFEIILYNTDPSYDDYDPLRLVFSISGSTISLLSARQHFILGDSAYNTKTMHICTFRSFLVINDGVVSGSSDYVLWIESITNSAYLATTNRAETISAVKTFSALPVSTVVPTDENQFTTKKYVDDAIASIDIPESGGSTIDFGDTPVYLVSTKSGTNMTAQHVILDDYNAPDYGTSLRKAINSGAKTFIISLFFTGYGMSLDLRYTINDDGSILVLKLREPFQVSIGSYIIGYSPTIENMVTNISSAETATMYLRVQNMNSSAMCPIVQNTVTKSYVDDAIANAITTVLEAEY